MNSRAKVALIVGMIVSATNVFAECKGYSGPGGPCYTGPGGGAYSGPGGPCYSGPGSPPRDQWNRPSPHCQ